jgi:hypothetical protein
MWKNIAELGRPQMTTGHMRIARWIPKAKTRSQNLQYLLLFTATIVARTLLSLMLCYTYIASLADAKVYGNMYSLYRYRLCKD